MLVVLMVTQHPARLVYYVAASVLGSTAGCYLLYVLANRGGHALHTAFAAKVLEEPDAWTLVEAGFDPAADSAVTLPIKDAVRRTEGLELGAFVTIALELGGN